MAQPSHDDRDAYGVDEDARRVVPVVLSPARGADASPRTDNTDVSKFHDRTTAAGGGLNPSHVETEFRKTLRRHNLGVVLDLALEHGLYAFAVADVGGVCEFELAVDAEVPLICDRQQPPVINQGKVRAARRTH